MDTTVNKKLEDFFTQFPLKKFKKGEILIHANQGPAGIFYIASGNIKQYAISSDGNEQILTIFKPHAFFPMVWAINNTPNTYFFEAMSDVRVHIAPKDAVLSFIEKNNDILYDLLSRLYRGMTGMLQRVEYLLGASAYHKVIFTILHTASRFGKEANNSSSIILRTTHKEIAGFSGLTKETISRESKKLQRKGLIENKNNYILIVNKQKLVNELHQKD